LTIAFVTARIATACDMVLRDDARLVLGQPSMGNVSNVALVKYSNN